MSELQRLIGAMGVTNVREGVEFAANALVVAGAAAAAFSVAAAGLSKKNVILAIANSDPHQPE
jgi:hypothetical protein